MSTRHLRKLHIGIVGAGAIVRDRHLPGLLGLRDVEITAVCNSSYESSKRFCQQHLPHATPMMHWADLLMLPDLDIVWVGTPPYLHAAATVSALEAGRHVFCQARMAMNLVEAEEMQAAAQRRPQLVTMLCPPPHGMRGDLVFRQLLGEGSIGRIYQVRLQSLSGIFADPDAPAHWRQRKELAGENVLTLGIYAEVLQRWLGPIAAVSAAGTVAHPFRRGYQVQVPDMLSVLCRFESGAEGVLEFSGVAAHAPGDRLEIYGSEGTLVYDFTHDRIFSAKRGDASLVEVEIPSAMAREWTVEQDFIAAVRSPGGIQPRPGFDEGVEYMRVVQGVANSMVSGRWVEL